MKLSDKKVLDLFSLYVDNFIKICNYYVSYHNTHTHTYIYIYIYIYINILKL